MISRLLPYSSLQTIQNGSLEKRFSLREVCGSIVDSATRKEPQIMKTKIVVLATAAMIAQVNAGDVRAGAAARPVAVAHPGTVAHAGPAARAPMRSGGISSFHPMPM